VQSDFCEIDGISFPVRRPNSVVELAELVVRARKDKEGVFPIGGGTMLGFGMPPGKKGTAADVRALARVTDYPARDMTVTVEAGITIAELRCLLAAERQRLPVDVPRAEAATLGGVLAANVSGARRYGWGTLRDYVIGISVINDEGQPIKAGGRVVKNVAGYDLCKLYIGSLGTLGVITQVTLKVVPEPEQHALVTLACAAEHLEELLDRLHQSGTRPVALELLSPSARSQVKPLAELEWAEDRWLVLVGYESNADAVNWQVQQLIKEVKTDYPLEARIGPTALPVWQALEEMPGYRATDVTLKAAMLPSRCPDFCRRLADLAPDVILQAHAGNGIVVAHADAGSAVHAATLVARCREMLGTAGSVVVPRCPTDWKGTVGVWGPRGDVRLMRAVKEQLDPDRVFNPGRFVDGL
jgi:glycolate oxidase FAD binding subunit